MLETLIHILPHTRASTDTDSSAECACVGHRTCRLSFVAAFANAHRKLSDESMVVAGIAALSNKNKIIHQHQMEEVRRCRGLLLFDPLLEICVRDSGKLSAGAKISPSPTIE